jgi:predicted MPP superfamily phosphohydrolase
MVLRFRDLVANTIIEHRKIIEEYNYVWWGWWNKPSEKIPQATFAQFSEVIGRDGHIDIYLIDSGKELLYKAMLEEIDFSKTEEGKVCREPEKTPSYYSTQKYKAWFRLASIEPLSLEEIRNWSYDEVADFFDDPVSAKFQDKRVFNIQEMLNRHHRTVYFIMPYDKTQHQDHLIKLVPSIGSTSHIDLKRTKSVEVVPPAEFKDFMTTPLYRDSTYILQLSDLHFSDTHHGFTIEPNRFDSPLVAFLDSDLKKMGLNGPPAAVIISGDFTWQGKEKEFDLAYDFIDNLQSLRGLEPEHFVVVPGNHDIQWSEETGDVYDRGEVRSDLPEVAEKNYRNFFEKIFGMHPNEFLSMGRRYILSNYIAVDIVGLNSSRLEQKYFAGFGYVSLAQLRNAAEAMGWKKEHREYRMLVLHHQVMPVTAKERFMAQRGTFERENGFLDKESTKYNYSITLDAEQLIYEALRQKIDLVAHGHTHQPFTSSISRASRKQGFSPSQTIAVHGAGSSGARVEDLGAIKKNSYSIYEFDEKGITITIRSWSENTEGFEEDWQCRLSRNSNGGLRLDEAGSSCD